MEAALVSAAAGALKPVLGKLAAVLGDEYKRFRGVHDEIGFLARELEAMEAFLLQKSMEEDPGVQDKLWMKEVREMSYDIEDSLDDFMENARDKSAKPDGFMKKIKNLLDKTKDRRQIAKVIEALKKQVIEVAERQNRYKADSKVGKVAIVDPRALAIFKDASNLVGIDGQKKELIRLFSQENVGESRQQQRREMISIVGFGGLGKTTLAYQVYKELKEEFDCHAFVSVSRNPNTKKVLETILNQVSGEVSGRDYASDEDIQQLIIRISNFLVAKRYFIVVDDIWNVEIWEAIQFAFPPNMCDCRIITTTRVNDIAQLCRSSFNGHVYTMKPLGGVHSRQLFHKRLFNTGECPPHLEEVSSQIMKKCAGLPLAIIAISGLLANKEKTKEQWHQVERSMGRGLERNATVEGMINIISRSYFDLPRHLKTCLLYLSIFPEDFIVEKEILIRRWIAEGFIQEKNGYTLYEVGEMCFNELLNRSLIQPDFENQIFDEVSGCRVHDTVLDFIVSKSVEENFVTIIGIPGIIPKPQNKVRRLSLQNNGTVPAGLILSSARSLNIFGNDVIIPSLLEFKDLRVLCFEDCLLWQNDNLAGIGNLLRLKCLRLNKVYRTNFSDEIAKLRYLETLDISYYSSMEGSVPPNISVNGRLVHFVPGGFNIPNEFEGMNSLEVLGRIAVEHQSSEFFRRLGHLTNLRKLALDIRSNEAQREIACSIRELAKANLRSLSINFDRTNTLKFLEELNLPSQCSLREIYLDSGPIRKVPRWMGSLVNLQKLRLVLLESVCPEDVKILGGLPNLRYIKVIWYYGLVSQGKAEMERVIEAHPNHPMLVSSDYLDQMRKRLSGSNEKELSDAQDFQPVAPVVGVKPIKSNWDDEDVEEDKRIMGRGGGRG